MKRRDFIRELVNAGCYLKRHGREHDVYVNSKIGNQREFLRIDKKAARAQMIHMLQDDIG